MKYKSCKDLEASLYVGPNEIRSCCQRFFYKGKMRGDAKLIDIKNDVTPTSQDIIFARKKIFNNIQDNKSESCTGCPFIYETETRPTPSRVSPAVLKIHISSLLEMDLSSL